MSLDVDVEHAIGGFTLAARFASSSRLTALFGPSGAGKTTLVQCLAGLRRARGRIAIDGATLLDSARGIDLPAHRRRVGYVFQEARLFPHLDVRRNLGYGRWFAPRELRRVSFDDVVGVLGLEALLARKPETLSGGEKQRVAIGRALLASPRLLLLDEPLASVDDARKGEILPYFERVRDRLGVPIVYVSHSVLEVARLAETVVVLAAGRVTGVDTAAAVLGESRDDAGVVLATTIAAHDEPYALTRLAFDGGALTVPRVAGAVGTPLRVYVRARDVMLGKPAPGGLSALNVLAAKVVAIRAAGASSVHVDLVCGARSILVATITRRAADMLVLAPGDAVHAIVKTVTLHHASW